MKLPEGVATAVMETTANHCGRWQDLPPSQNTSVYHMVVQCSQMFANNKHSITVFNEHLFDVCEDSSKRENVSVWRGKH